MVRHGPAVQCFFRCRPYGLYLSGFGASRKGPASQHISRIGVGTDKCDLLIRGKRQDGILIFKQYEGFHRRFICQLPVFFTEKRAGFPRLVGSVKGILKQSQPVFKLQNSQDTFVEKRLFQYSVFHQSDQILRIYAGHHIDIDSRFQRAARGIRPIFGDTVNHRLSDRRVIRDQYAVKSHFTAQNFPEQRSVYGCGYPVHRLKRGHSHSASGLYGALIGRQIKFMKCPIGELHRLIFPPAFRRTVSREMLDAGGQKIRSALLPLIAFHH